MSARRISRSQIETIVPNMQRNGEIDLARKGDSFTAVTNTVTGASPTLIGEEFIERYYFHARGGATFDITQVTPDLDTRWTQNVPEVGNFQHAMRYEVNTADATLAADDYYLIEGYLDGGDVRAVNLGGEGGDPNFPRTNINERTLNGMFMISFWLRSNIAAVGNAFHFSFIDDYNGQSMVTPLRLDTPMGNYSEANGQWNRYAAFFRNLPVLSGKVSGVPPAIAAGSNSMPPLSQGKRILRWGLGLSCGANMKLTDNAQTCRWSIDATVGPPAIDVRFLKDDFPERTPIQNFVSTAGNYIEMTKINIEAGSGPARLAPNPFGVEKELCDRYFQTSYQPGVFPGAVAAAGRIVEYSSGHTAAGFTMKQYVPLRPSMVAVPTITLYSPTTGTSNRVEMNGVDVTPTSVEVFQDGFIVEATGASNAIRNMEFHFTAEAELT